MIFPQYTPGFLLLVLTRRPELSVLIVPFSVLDNCSSSLLGRPTFLTIPVFLGLLDFFSSTLLLVLVEFFKVIVGLPLVLSTDFNVFFDDDEASSEILQ